MSNKKGKWTTFMEMLFMYLAISKILYWFGTVYAMVQDDLGSVAEAVLMRLLNQDVMIIVGVVLFFGLEKLIDMKKAKYNKFMEYILLYVVGYILLMGAFLAYSLIINLFLEASFNWNEFLYFIRLSLLWYLIIIIILNTKSYLKGKEKKITEDDPAIYSKEEKLTMLEILLKNDILTQEEFDIKREKVLAMT